MQLVSCEHPELADLPAQLLGRTLIVRDLADRAQVAEQAKGFRFITLAGELLEPDGTVTVGTPSGGHRHFVPQKRTARIARAIGRA